MHMCVSECVPLHLNHCQQINYVPLKEFICLGLARVESTKCPIYHGQSVLASHARVVGVAGGSGDASVAGVVAVRPRRLTWPGSG